MAILYKRDLTITVPDDVVAEYEADGWSRDRSPRPVVKSEPAPKSRKRSRG